MRVAGLATALSVALALAAIGPPQALAADSSAALSDARQQTGASQDRPPVGRKISERRAIEIANRDPKVRATRRRHPDLDPQATPKPTRWEVSYFAGGEQLALVFVDDASGEVTESWTGYQVAWQMARGYPGAFGRKINAPYVWIPLCAVFLFGLLDWRRPWRIAHLDLLVLLGFGVSHFFFNRAEIGVSVPLVYPVLLYLMARLLWIGFRGRGQGLRPTAPIAWLAVATLFLVGFRVGLNVVDSNVIDVGYSGVIGGDRIAHGEQLYGNFPRDNQFGDTYGPAAYYPYVPFELVLPWEGAWDELPAAHGAAILFDLAALAGLFLLGRRLRPGERGEELGVWLAFAWAAFPYTAFALESNANDSLVAALLIATLLVATSAPARGALAALAGLTKFASLALVPMLATYEDEHRSPRRGPALALFALAFAATAGLLFLQPALDPGLGETFDRTFGFQASRDSPFSIWGQEGLDGLRVGIEVAVAALAVLLALVPRRKSPVQLAALGAALLLGVQLTLQHWFYLYIVWFLPLVIVALAAIEPDQEEGTGSSSWEIDSASPSERTSTSAAITQTSSSAVSN